MSTSRIGTGSSGRELFLLVSLVMFASAAGIAWAMAIPTFDVFAVIYLGLLILVTIVPIFFILPKGMKLPVFVTLSPISLFSIEALFVRLGVGNWHYHLEDLWHPIVTQDALLKAAALTLLGSLFMWAGYAMSSSKKLAESLVRRIGQEIQNDEVYVNWSFVYAAFAIGILIRLYMIASGIGGYFSEQGLRQSSWSYIEYLKIFEEMANLALLVLFTYMLQSRSSAWMLFWLLFAVEVLTALLMGFKGQILFRFFYLIIIYAKVRGTFHRSIFIAAIIAFVVIYPLTQTMRASWNQGDIETGNLVQLSSTYVAQGQQLFSISILSTTIQEAVNSILRHFGQMENLAGVIAYMDATDAFLFGAEYVQVFTTFIPRAIWPSKPSLYLGGWIQVVVFERPAGSADTPTVPGNFYLNFGTAGLLLGMLFFGILLRMVGTVILNMTSIRYIPLIPYMMVDFGEPGGLLGPHIAGTIRFYVIFVLIMMVLVPSARPTRLNGY